MALERVLVVDDDKLNVELLATLLEQEGVRPACAFNGRQAWEQLQQTPANLVFMDLRMPRMDGMELLKNIRVTAPGTAIVMMTAYGTVETAVEAMRLGAYDYVTKPLRADRIAMLLRRLRERDEGRVPAEVLREDTEMEHTFDRLVTVDGHMRQVCEATRRAAASKASVLVQGESGTGKELIARFIHELSPRREKPFIKMNCAALPESLLESEMFGHERGAFTGAVTRRPGRFELASGGTLLLDEVSEISPALQAKLLRVLEEEAFERVGGASTLSVDVRVIATTNRDLPGAIANGLFRPDLYYRLNVIPIALPPLRDRRGDVPHLVGHFLTRFCRESGRPSPRVTDEAMRLLCRHHWPGNVRELKNLMQRLAVLNTSEVIGPEHLPPEMSGRTPAAGPATVTIGQTVEDAERWLILNTLRHTNGNRTRAAEMLGITTRTLRNKLARYRADGLLGSGGTVDAPDDEPAAPDGQNVPAASAEAATISLGMPFAQSPLHA